MFIGKTLPFVSEFVEELNGALKSMNSDAELTKAQKGWLEFCLLAIMVTNSVCWKHFERASLGYRSHAALSFMFRRAAILWEFILRASVSVIVAKYGIKEGVLVIDDSDKKRSKRTKRIYKTHKVKDKSSGGFFNGQSFVTLLLVSPKVTIPAGVEFYKPDPMLTAWRKKDGKLKKLGVPKKDRPPEPPKNSSYPKKWEIALCLLNDFKLSFPNIDVKCVLADNLYGHDSFVDRASAIFGGTQVISKLRNNQKARFQGKEIDLAAFFKRYPGVEQKLRVRGGAVVGALISSARLHVRSHGKKRFVIALKYEGEEEYRYLSASDLSWRTLDIVQAYSHRWLAEVFFQDWKSYEGWGRLAKQPDEEGSRRGLILSLPRGHRLLLHPEQPARIENKLPAVTVGSLLARIKVDSLTQFFKDVIFSSDPYEKLELLTRQAKKVFILNNSGKHMVGRDLGRLEPTPSLRYRVEAA